MFTNGTRSMVMLDDATSYRFLKLIADHPEYSQRQLAEAMGVSLGRTNYCMQALVEKGLVKVGNFRRNPNKEAYIYLLTPEGVQEKAQVTLRFLKRKMQEYDALKAEIAALCRDADQIDMQESCNAERNPS